MGTVARQTAYAVACAEPKPAAPAGSVWLNPRPSKAVNYHDIVFLIIYWIWLKSYLNTTWPLEVGSDLAFPVGLVARSAISRTRTYLSKRPPRIGLGDCHGADHPSGAYGRVPLIRADAALGEEATPPAAEGGTCLFWGAPARYWSIGQQGPSCTERERGAVFPRLGSVDVGFQPDLVYYHENDVVFIDDPGGRDFNLRNRLSRPVQAPRRPQNRYPAAQLTP